MVFPIAVIVILFLVAAYHIGKVNELEGALEQRPEKIVYQERISGDEIRDSYEYKDLKRDLERLQKEIPRYHIGERINLHKEIKPDQLVSIDVSYRLNHYNPDYLSKAYF